MSNYIDTVLDKGVNFRSRTIYLDQEINDNTTALFIRALHLLETSGTQPINVFINSEGGCVTSGMAIYDAIRSCRCVVNVVGFGMVCSIATVVYLAGQQRALTPHCEVMFHPISVATDGTVPDVEIFMNRVQQQTKDMIDIYVERTKKRRAFWVGIKNDRYFSSKQCLEYGIAHDVIEYPEEF